MRQQILVTISSALSALAPQTLALVLLAPVDFGHFSIVYLVYAFGVSVSASVVSEPWHIRALDERPLDWTAYILGNLSVSAIVATLSFATAAGLGTPLPHCIVLALAASMGVYRASARYYLVQRNSLKRAAAADLVFVTIILGATVFLRVHHHDELLSIYIAWAAAGIFSIALLPRPRGIAKSPLAWVRTHRVHIRRLLPESLLMDVGAIFTPALLAPVLGAAAFGTYRAVSNVAAPVRLILNPLRPQIISNRDSTHQVAQRHLRYVIVSGLLLGTTAAGALQAIDAWKLKLGVLDSLAPFSFAVGIVVSSNFVGHYSYIQARSRLDSRELLFARVVQTILVSSFPIIGVLSFALPGAIWATTLASVLVAVLWWWMNDRWTIAAKIGNRPPS